MLWHWLFAAPALLLAFLSLRGERRRARYVSRRLCETARELPPASVIVPVKGFDEGLRQNLAALAALDYPDYELIVVADTARDIPAGVLPARVKVVLAHGADDNTGEKVRNLQAAVRATRKCSQVFAFADSDGCPSRGWLRALVAPLSEEGVAASTGYRWFAPDPADFWSLVRGVWDSVTFGLLGDGDCPFVWGGAMAIRKETFFAARVPEYWHDTVSDDYALLEAVHAAHLRIAYAPGALVASVEHVGALAFFRWIRRQLTITRVYNPRLWRLGVIGHTIYCAGMVASAVALACGHVWAAWVLALQLAPGMAKSFVRTLLARSALPSRRAWFARYRWVHVAAVPLVTWIWMLALLSTARGNRIEWRGRCYRIQRHRAVERL